MSKYITWDEVKFTNEALLIEALQRCGWTKDQIEVHPEGAHLMGFEGSQRDEVAHIVIRRRHVGRLSNDLGFVKKDGAYVPLISEYDQEHLKDRRFQGTAPAAAIRAAYSEAVVDEVTRRMRGTATKEQSGATRRIIVRY
ncbi:MAG: hypothetical protein LC754_10570 [Acidobacteria bacterium]|nr:hypothetical protein [Acidobacteriota bacterium]